jgi:Tfp pilus assembly pilus retraction ATPase PilT
MDDYDIFSDENLLNEVSSMLNEKQKLELKTNLELDFSIDLK